MDRCLTAMFRYRRLGLGAATAIIVFGATDIVAQTPSYAPAGRPAPTVPQPPVNEYGQQQQLQQQERRQQLLQPQQLPLEQQQQRAGQPAGAATDDANAGEAALNRNDYNTAIEMFTRAIASGGLSPADAESAYVERAKAYIGLGNGAAAQSDLNLARQLNPNDPEIASLQATAQAPIGTRSATPAASGPSLEDTLAFLVQAIAGQGTLHWSSTIHDPSGYLPDYKNRYSEEYSKLRADPLSCRIYYHSKDTLDADVISDIDMEISLSSILSVERISLEQSEAMFHAQTGLTPTSTEVYDSSVAVVYMPKSLPAGTPAGPIAPFYEVTFIDPNLADRVANGFRHAAELCGAKQQPF